MPAAVDPEQLGVRLWRRSLGGIFVLFLLLLAAGAIASLGVHGEAADLWITIAALFVTGSAAVVAACRHLRRTVRRRELPREDPLRGGHQAGQRAVDGFGQRV
jgi:peptidoglycan/LPS O-acetylase OafA/YrhL